jgi:hypothetical protein
MTGGAAVLMASPNTGQRYQGNALESVNKDIQTQPLAGNPKPVLNADGKEKSYCFIILIS